MPQLPRSVVAHGHTPPHLRSLVPPPNPVSKGTVMYALQPALVEQPNTSATAHAAFYAAAHARLQGALGTTGRRVALDTVIDLYRAHG